MLAIVKIKNSEITVTYFVHRPVYTRIIYTCIHASNMNKISISIHV